MISIFLFFSFVLPVSGPQSRESRRQVPIVVEIPIGGSHLRIGNSEIGRAGHGSTTGHRCIHWTGRGSSVVRGERTEGNTSHGREMRWLAS